MACVTNGDPILFISNHSQLYIVVLVRPASTGGGKMFWWSKPPIRKQQYMKYY